MVQERNEAVTEPLKANAAFLLASLSLSKRGQIANLLIQAILWISDLDLKLKVRNNTRTSTMAIQPESVIS